MSHFHIIKFTIEQIYYSVSTMINGALLLEGSISVNVFAEYVVTVTQSY